MITREELIRHFHYDPDTGLFYRKGENLRLTGHTCKTYGYVTIGFKNKKYQAHRMAWLYMHSGELPKLIDHKNGIRNDNRACNLRPATYSQNYQNRGCSKNSKSGIKGVSWHKDTRKWQAQAMVNRKLNFLGVYQNIEDAEAAYKRFTKEAHGEFYREG